MTKNRLTTSEKCSEISTNKRALRVETNASTPQNELDDLAQGFKKMGNLWAKATWTLHGEERNELTF